MKPNKFSAKQIKGAWRIVDPNGKPALNARGMPIDRGGFVDAYEAKQHIQRQAKFSQVMAKITEQEDP